jgi:uncharacterized protein YbjQ (UPF0145 family)
MALQSVAGGAQQLSPQDVPATATTAVSSGTALSTRETANRPFIELGVMFGQALGGREPVMQALTNLQSIGHEHGCDAVIAVRLLHYTTTAGPAVVAYGTGVRFVSQPDSAGGGGLAGQASGGLGDTTPGAAGGSRVAAPPPVAR